MSSQSQSIERISIDGGSDINVPPFPDPPALPEKLSSAFPELVDWVKAYSGAVEVWRQDLTQALRDAFDNL